MSNEPSEFVLLMDTEYRTYMDMDELLAETSAEEIAHHNWKVYSLGDEITVRTRTQWKAVGDTQWRITDE